MAKVEASSKPENTDLHSQTTRGEGSQGVKNPDKGGLGKPLYQPKEGEANVDIVFVHGINGDRIGTWTYKDSESPDNDQMWPRDFLPTKLPNAQIVSFGYNADFAKFYPEDRKNIAPELTIDDYSVSLLESVRALRKGKEDRPIVFVAHSMGGLVVANALSRDLNSDQALQSIPDHTIGALFLGTPFRGSELASYGSLAVNLLTYIVRTQPDSLETLTKKSKKLADINAKFAKFLMDRAHAHEKPRLRIACFFEGIPTRGLPIIKAERLVVPKESATWPGVDPLSIDANHVNMCRFDCPDREGFQKVSGKLVQWVDEYEASKKAGGMGGGGVCTQGIQVSGDVKYEGARLYQSATAGHVVGTTQDAVRIGVYNSRGGSGSSEGNQDRFDKDRFDEAHRFLSSSD